MSSSADTRQVMRLRNAIARYARGDVSPEDWTRDACAAVFEDASIGLTAGQLTAAATVFGRLPFYGGNFTADAKRLLAAVNRGDDE
jgi:hypothetical protein